MKIKRPTTQSDPGGLFTSLGALIALILSGLVTAGVIPEDVANEIMVFVGPLLPIVVGLAIRYFAFAPDSVKEKVEEEVEKAIRVNFSAGDTGPGLQE